MSSTWLKIVDSYTPYHLRSYLDSPPADPTPALVMGAAVDTMIFEPEQFERHFLLHPTIDRRTKVGKEDWAALVEDAKKTGRYLIREDAHQEALETARSIRTNPVMADILKRGVAQPVFVWRDPVTGLLCKCKLDWYDEEAGLIVDLKTANDASKVAFSKAIANYGYHIQQAFYSDGVRVCGKPAKKFIFAVQEKPDNKNTFKADPRLMAFYELDQEDEDAGRDSYASALSAIQFCTANNEWAGYSNVVQSITRPAWARRGDMQDVVSL